MLECYPKAKYMIFVTVGTQGFLVITNSGVATIQKAKKFHKSVIAFLRLAKYKEYVDDHQVQITENFIEQGLILGCKDENNLLNVIELAKKFDFKE